MTCAETHFWRSAYAGETHFLCSGVGRGFPILAFDNIFAQKSIISCQSSFKKSELKVYYFDDLIIEISAVQLLFFSGPSHLTIPLHVVFVVETAKDLCFYEDLFKLKH